ncbi:MAG: ATP-dependent protease subunit HslV [Bacteroidetes bacterium QS_4_64_154]|nr:MAG: ATP-dependent protease subunit HslV [Bacteroidetes bacterium QS_4_64_154]
MTAETDSPHATTVLGVRHNGQIALGSDGQATMDETVVKHKAEKVRSLYDGEIIAGFAGSTADAFTLFERFEDKLQEYGGNVARAAVELAKEWRTDKYLEIVENGLSIAADICIYTNHNRTILDIDAETS